MVDFEWKLRDQCAGHIDLFDTIIRIDASRRSGADLLFATEQHEFLHYMLLAATPIGFRHLVAVDEIVGRSAASLSQYSERITLGSRIPLDSPLGDAAQGGQIRKVLDEISQNWKFVKKFPSNQGLVFLEDHPMQLDPSRGLVSFRDVFQYNVGLHAVFEHMSRAAEYNNRALLHLSSRGDNENDFVAGIRTGKTPRFDPILGNQIVGEVLPPSGLLYDFPSFLNHLYGWPSVNVGLMFTLLCGWISLMTADWVTAQASDNQGEDVGKFYLYLLTQGADDWLEVYEQEARDSLEAVTGAFDALKLGDRLTSKLGLPIFSESVSAQITRLETIAEMMKSPDEEESPKSALHWHATDGGEILRALIARPIRFFFPLSNYKPEFPNSQLPGPPVLYRDSAISPRNGGDRRVGHHLGCALVKEILFQHHRIVSLNGPTEFEFDQCGGGLDCIVEHSKRIGFESTLSRLLHSILTTPHSY